MLGVNRILTEMCWLCSEARMDRHVVIILARRSVETVKGHFPKGGVTQALMFLSESRAFPAFISAICLRTSSSPWLATMLNNTVITAHWHRVSF